MSDNDETEHDAPRLEMCTLKDTQGQHVPMIVAKFIRRQFPHVPHGALVTMAAFAALGPRFPNKPWNDLSPDDRQMIIDELSIPQEQRAAQQQAERDREAQAAADRKAEERQLAKAAAIAEKARLAAEKEQEDHEKQLEAARKEAEEAVEKEFDGWVPGDVSETRAHNNTRDDEMVAATITVSASFVAPCLIPPREARWPPSRFPTRVENRRGDPSHHPRYRVAGRTDPRP